MPNNRDSNLLDNHKNSDKHFNGLIMYYNKIYNIIIIIIIEYYFNCQNHKKKFKLLLLILK